MPSTYKTPGVYIEEISTLPASIAQVETAIPAFIGFTKEAKKNGKQIANVPTRITSLLEFEEYFGKGPEELTITVDLNTDNSVAEVTVGSPFCLYDSMRMFYSNGGGPCYIVSVGDFTTQTASQYFTAFETGLATLRKEDEPTLILFPDAAKLFGSDEALTTNEKAKLGSLQKLALKQCNDLQDRFCIFDVADGNIELNEQDSDAKTADLAFRDNVGVQYLKYSAAYYPFLKTTLSFDFGYENIKGNISKNGTDVTLSALSTSSVIVDHYDKVLTDKTAFDAIVDAPNYAATPGDTDLLNVAPFTALNVYEGYEAIEEKYEGTGSTAKNRIHARIQYIWEMITKIAGLTMTDTEDEDSDSTTNKDLSAILSGLVGPATVAPPYSTLEGVVRDLLSYNLAVTNGGAPDPATLTGLAAGATIVIGANTYNTTGAVADATIYDSPTNWSEAADSSKATFLALFEEVSSIYQQFEAELSERIKNLELLLTESEPIYASIVKAIKKEGIVLPPSGAVAGVYAATDNERGVWVAPANRSLNSVVGPKVNITAEEQGGLNVDVTAGKSINAIRSFTGKGTLIWGARTLAGNSNEWRYIPVRRLFNMVEESVKKATEFVVFEPNDKNTWVRTKGMIENFLNQIWKAGGLAGAKAEHAYIVKIGLGETMTAQDILEGRMIVEIHLAAVRPAEFIILRFMHKLQES